MNYYFLVGVISFLTIFVFRRLLHSRVGRAFSGVRDNEVLAECLGIQALRYKLTAFTIGAIFAGLAGSLYAHYLRYICPRDFSFAESFDLVGHGGCGRGADDPGADRGSPLYPGPAEVFWV